MRRCPRPVLPLGALFTAAVTVAACADEPLTRPPMSEEGPAARETLGLVEITISGLGGPGDPSAGALSAADVDELRRLRAARKAGETAGESAAVPDAFTAPDNSAKTGDGTIQIEPLSTGSFTDGERGAGGVRYFWATYRVRNAQADGTAYDTPRQNLTFVAVTDGTTLGGHTPISALNVYGGGAAAGSIADAIVPTGAASRNQNTMRVVSHHPDVLQVFTETEAGAITPPAGVTDVFPYGFIVRRTRVGHDTRVLPADPAPGIYDGVVTFAFTMPLQATPADDPFTVSALFAAYDDGDTRVTQSVEEQSGIAAGEFAERAANLGAASVSLLPGGRYVGTTTTFLRCDVRATGTAGSPTAYVHEAASADPWLVTDPFGATGDGPAFLPPTARIRAARCGGVWNTPTASSFVVHAMQSGPSTGSYIGTGGGAFTADTIADVGSRPRGIAAGDLDGDGALDLAVLDAQADDVPLPINQ